MSIKCVEKITMNLSKGYNPPAAFSNFFSEGLKFQTRPKLFESDIPCISKLYVVKMEKNSSENFEKELVLIELEDTNRAIVCICKEKGRNQGKNIISNEVYGSLINACQIHFAEKETDFNSAYKLSLQMTEKLKNAFDLTQHESPASIDHDLKAMSAVVLTSNKNSESMEKAISSLFGEKSLYGDTLIIPENNIDERYVKNMITGGARVLLAEEELKKFSGNFLLDFLNQEHADILAKLGKNSDQIIVALTLKIPIISHLWQGWENMIGHSLEEFIKNYFSHQLFNFGKKLEQNE